VKTEIIVPRIDVDENFWWKTKGQTMAMVTFVDVVRANRTSIDMKGQKQRMGHKPRRNVISVRLFHDIVSSRDREVNQDTRSKSTEQTYQDVT
jgi:hypothetical protein